MCAMEAAAVRAVLFRKNMFNKQFLWRSCTLALALSVIAAQAQTEPPADDTEPLDLPTITITGVSPISNILKQQKLTPGATELVHGETFYERPVSNMGEALRYVPGVTIDSNAGGSSGKLSMRGSNLNAINYDNAGVLLLQDGLPVTSADGANHNRLLDPLTASDVIVAHGTNALYYGASQLGGALNFVSRTARNSDPRYVYLSGGSHGRFHGLVSAGGVSDSDTLDGMVTLERRGFRGWRQHSRDEQTSLYGNLGLKVSPDLNLRLFATHINSREQLAGALTRAEFDADRRQADRSYVLGDHLINVKTDRIALKGDWRAGQRSRLEFGISHERQSLYHPIVDVFDFSSTPPMKFFSLLIDTKQKTTAGMVRYLLDLDQHEIVASLTAAHTSNKGAHFENDAGQHGTRSNNINQSANNFTLSLLDRWQVAPQWTVVYGGQGVITHRNLFDENLAFGGRRHQRARYSSLNPRIGVIRQLGEHSEVFANVSRVWQAPSNFELDNDVRKSNATLHPLHGISYEIGTRGRGPLPLLNGTGYWSVALYHARLRGEMLSVEDPTQPGTQLATNYGRTNHTGLEARLGASVQLGGVHRLEPLISVSLNRFNFVDDPTFGNNRLPAAPRYMVHGEMIYRQAATGFYAGPTFDLVGSRYADMANSYRVGGYGLIGLRAGMQKGRWEFYAEARNLTDHKYANAVVPRTVAAADARVLNPGAPRSFFVGLRMNY